jgi:DNA helicase-2/ATP-dependent DNA helicase PcrA
MTTTKNRLFIAAAGSGKTQLIINEAIKKTKSNLEAKILITTFTEANKAEIKRKFKNKQPKNVTVQSWFSFLIQHSVKPFQGTFDKKLQDFKVKGLYLINKQSAKGIPENEVIKYYFLNNKIYSDKLSKFAAGGGKENRKIENRKNFVSYTINRLSEIFTDIYIDEAQDLAGNDIIY